MISFPITPSVLKSMLRFVSTDQTRYVLCGIHVICKPYKPVRLESTDGRRLLIHDTDWQHDATEPADFIIPRDVIAVILAAKESRVTPPRLFLDGRETRAVLGDVTIEFLSIDGNYPDTKRGFPALMPTAFPAKTVGLNPSYLIELLQAVEELEPQQKAVRLVSDDDPDSAVFALARKTTAALMPLRYAEELQGASK